MQLYGRHNRSRNSRGKSIYELRYRKNSKEIKGEAIGILEELARALGVSAAELLTGDFKENEKPSGNMKKLHFYVCPVCGNIITAVGQSSISCCGVSLPELLAEPEEDAHGIAVETVDHEYCVTMTHPM